MKNIFLFIRRYLSFFSFLLLQVICIVMLSRSSKTHETFFASAANEVTGGINKRYSGFSDFFGLKETNRQLAEENARLRNLLASNYVIPETSKVQHIDSLVKDTLGRVRKFLWLPAKVVSNSYTSQSNYIMVERGSSQGVARNMAVTGPGGSIVGVVVETSPNYARIMSLLHRNSKVSAMLKRDNSTGSIEWDGGDPGFLTLRNVTKGAKVVKGDTVLTSNYSANFPPQLMIGTISEISSESASNFYTLKVRTATNFFNIQHVNIIANTRYAEQVELQNNTTKNP